MKTPTAKQKVLRALMVRAQVRQNILCEGIASCLHGERPIDADTLEAIRLNLTELEDATAQADKAADEYYATNPFRRGRRRRAIVKARKNPKGKKASK